MKNNQNLKLETLARSVSANLQTIHLCQGWPTSRQRCPESLFQTPTPLLFQNFWIRVWQFFKFENPPPVQTPATIIDPTVIYPCFYLRNDHTDSCNCRNWKVTPVPAPVLTKFLTPGPKEKRRILPESTLVPVPPLCRPRSTGWSPCISCSNVPDFALNGKDR